MIHILAADPGISGGVAVIHYDPVTKHREVLTCVMPTTEHVSGKGRMVDRRALRMWLQEQAPGLTPFTLAVVELVDGSNMQPRGDEKAGKKRFGVSATSMFNFGFSFAFLYAVAEDLSAQLLTPTPKQWQKKMFAHAPAGNSAGKVDTKAKSRAVARKLFPSADLRRTVKCTTDHDGICDAICLAQYGLEYLTGGEEK